MNERDDFWILSPAVLLTLFAKPGAGAGRNVETQKIVGNED